MTGMRAIRTYEMHLFERLLAGLARIDGIRLWGIADPARLGERTPTAALTLDACSPREAAEALGRQGITAWDGDFYAQGLIERFGLFETGGVLRHRPDPLQHDRGGRPAARSPGHDRGGGASRRPRLTRAR